MALIPIEEFFADGTKFNGGLYRGKCANHPNVEYLTKGPGRSLHYVGNVRECKCAFSEILIDSESQKED